MRRKPESPLTWHGWRQMSLLKKLRAVQSSLGLTQQGTFLAGQSGNGSLAGDEEQCLGTHRSEPGEPVALPGACGKALTPASVQKHQTRRRRQKTSLSTDMEADRTLPRELLHGSCGTPSWLRPGWCVPPELISLTVIEKASDIQKTKADGASLTFQVLEFK